MSDEIGEDGSVSYQTDILDDAGGSDDQSFSDMQDRMESGDDNPWFSDSQGSVVDKDGSVLVDPETNKPFDSIEQYNEWLEAQKAKLEEQKNKTEIPKKEEQKQASNQQQTLKSFESYLGGKVTADKLQELANAGSGFVYENDLLPQIDSNYKQDDTQLIDPVDKIREDRKAWEAVAVSPIEEVMNILVENGADPVVAKELLKPIIDRQRQIVESKYQQAYEKALEERFENKFSGKLSAIDQERLDTTSKKNVDYLASKYYQNGGADAFLALVGGYTDESGNQVRGPAAVVVDFIAAIANDGKKYGNEQDRQTDYVNTFKRVTSDHKKAQALFDIVHNYYIGKQFNQAKNVVYKQGKEAAKKQEQRVAKTIRTKPASYAPPASDPKEGLPKMLQDIMY